MYSLCVFLHSLCAFTQYIHIISINQELMCTTQFQALLVGLNPPKGTF